MSVREWFFGGRFSGQLDRRKQSYEVVFVVAVVVWMFAIRAYRYPQFLTSEGVIHPGTDSWYHRRMIEYTFVNYPERMAYDPWTQYPVGGSAGQFGSLFDQALATVAHGLALVIPETTALNLVFLFSAPVLGAVVAVPLYVIVRRVDGVLSAMGVLILLALLPGEFLSRSMVGNVDHHVAEVLLLSVFLMGFVVSLQHARNVDFSVSSLFSRDSGGVIWLSLFTGVIGVAYIWVWPPGIIVFAGVVLALAVAGVVKYESQSERESVWLVGGLSLGTMGVLSVFRIETWEFSFLTPSLFHVLVPLAFSMVLFLLLGLARGVSGTQFDGRVRYSGLVIGLTGVGIGFSTVVFTDPFFQTLSFVFEFLNRFNAPTQTIAEAQPLIGGGFGVTRAVLEYGGLLLPIVLGFVIFTARTVDRSDSERILLLVFGFGFGMAALIQIRFNTYFALFAAYFSIQLFREMIVLVEFPDRLSNIQVTHIYTVFVILLLVVPGLVFPVQSTAYGVTERESPGQYLLWEPTLEWVSDNTPPVEGPELQLYGTYVESSYEYPESAYGVLSWWDFGHWITIRGERIPVTNPFQSHAPEAATLLLAQNESTAEEYPSKWASDSRPSRYVVIEWSMASPQGSLNSMAIFHPSYDPSDFSRSVFLDTDTRRETVILSDEYYRSFVTRLYHYHGSAVQTESYVVETDMRETDEKSIERISEPGSFVQKFSTSEAHDYVNTSQNAQIGGVGLLSTTNVSALEHYRLVYASPRSIESVPSFSAQVQSDQDLSGLSREKFVSLPRLVKVFERVPGATVHGTTHAGATVTANVTMTTPNGGSFVYTQLATADSDGQFELVVPYSTSGYDEYGPENGHTNVSVQSDGPYVLTATVDGEVIETTTVDVPEKAVVETDTWDIVVEMAGKNND